MKSNWVKSIHVDRSIFFGFEQSFQNIVNKNVVITRNPSNMIHTKVKMYVMIINTAHDIRPPTRALQARYTFCLVAPVVKQPKHKSMKPRAAIQALPTMNIICSASIHINRKWNTSSNISIERAEPRYIVPQNTPTPRQHIIVAMSVAWGTRARQAWHASPIVNVDNFFQKSLIFTNIFPCFTLNYDYFHSLHKKDINYAYNGWQIMLTFRFTRFVHSSFITD